MENTTPYIVETAQARTSRRLFGTRKPLTPEVVGLDPDSQKRGFSSEEKKQED